MCAQSRQAVLEDHAEGPEVGLHESVVHLEEGQVRGEVEEVRQTDEGVGRLHVQEEDGRQEGHALHIAHVRAVAGIRPQDVVQRLMKWPSLR